MTLKELAREAIDIQDACNLFGIVSGMLDAMRSLREQFPKASNEELYKHPITRLWASKIHDLARMGLSNIERYAEAYQSCKELAG